MRKFKGFGITTGCVAEFLKSHLCYADANIAVLSHFVLTTQAECFPTQVPPYPNIFVKLSPM